MTALAADQVLTLVDDPARATDREHVAASTQVFVGSLLEKTGLGVQPYDGTGTADFAGLALDSADNSAGALGDQAVRVMTRGRVVTTINDTISALDEGATVYAPSDNLQDLTKTAGTDLPVGKIARVLATGTLGTNKVELMLEADGFRSI